ncbi:hypothetical protein H0H81_002576 [Sphagnurus paluster]|uniref:DUF8191 domain-containing protein n=1 Tax=Sphagnurus paluster TaxID=117069 RepID=A0A9P7GJI5_9AGAR|nr:hypothetical protein H0H81_002576 [Sphagnurus paluster]
MRWMELTKETTMAFLNPSTTRQTTSTVAQSVLGRSSKAFVRVARQNSNGKMCVVLPSIPKTPDGLLISAQVENDSESLIPADSLYTDPTYDSDRMQAPRGDTPLPNVGPFRPLPGYTREMYMALLQRGATRLMIETFKLHFTPEHGIFAWADATLYDEFSGPAMLNGDCWKIQLGRRFDLDEDDLDGAAFIEGILEEAVMFPKVPQQWETVLECPGVWVTRMVADWVAAAAADEDDEDDDDKNDDGEDDANADDDDADDDDDDDEDMDKEAREYHIRCGDLPLEDNGPVRRCPGYDTSDDHGSDDEMNAPIGEDGSVTQSDDVDMEEDMGWAFSASAPDGDFDPGSDEKDEPVPRGANVEGQEPVPRNQENVNLAGEGNPTEANDSTTLDRDDSMNDTDSVDSDFDDDEILSGDEELAAHAAIVMNFKYTYGDGRRAPGQ